MKSGLGSDFITARPRIRGTQASPCDAVLDSRLRGNERIILPGCFRFLNPLESAQNHTMPRRVVDVLVPVALDKPYSYRVPEALAVAPGDVVSVPRGAREATAVVWAENPKPNPRLDNRLKDIEDKIDVPPLRPELRSFVDWVSNYTLSSRGMVLRMSLRMGEHLGAERERTGVRFAG